MEKSDTAAAHLCHWVTDCLKNNVRDAKFVFTAALDIWMRSVPNDTERFVDFLSKNGEVFYASSNRALIMFVVARRGTPFQDNFFVEM